MRRPHFPVSSSSGRFTGVGSTLAGLRSWTFGACGALAAWCSVARLVADDAAAALELVTFDAGPDESAPIHPSPREAREIYGALCTNCHGADLRGGPGPALARRALRADTDASDDDDDDVIAATIRDGRAETGMPPMGAALSEEEIRSLVHFLREEAARLAHSHAFADGADDAMPTPIPDLVLRSEKHAFRLEVVTEALETPWSIAFLPEGAMLVTEKEGRLRLIEDGCLRPEPVRGTPAVWHRGQGGLLDVGVHPAYAENGWIYLSYSDPGPEAGMIAVARGRLRDGAWVDEEIVFRVDADLLRPGGAQFGSRLVLDPDGHLFFSIGDRDFPDDAQDLARPNGKIHRLRDDGGIPEDNPFVNHAGALASIWSYGHRNPQGLSRHPLSRELFSAEHGPRGGDELNLIQPGRNYGWPLVTHGANYDGTLISDRTAAEGMEQPLVQWTPSIGVCAIGFYTGSHFPNWRNQLFLTALVQEELRRIDFADGQVVGEEVLFRGLGRVRDVASGPDGFLYVALNSPDRIVRLVPAEAE